MAQIEVKVQLDLPEGAQLLGCERVAEGRGFEVKFPLPDSSRCEQCGREEAATYEYKKTVYVVRDLDLRGQPSFLVFQPGHSLGQPAVFGIAPGFAQIHKAAKYASLAIRSRPITRPANPRILASSCGRGGA